MAGHDKDFDDGLGEFDNFDNWDDAGWDDAGTGVDNNSRKPIESLKGGFKEGFKDSFKDPNVQKRLLKRALPEGYGKAIDAVDSGVETVRTLYDKTVSELKPQLKEMLRSTQKILPPGTKILPEKLSNKLAEFIKDEESYSQSRDEQEGSEISIALGEIFKQQAEVNEEREERQDREDKLRDGIRQKQFKTNLDQIAAIRSGIEKMVGYQDSITIAFQRKSLELQYRHYFATRRLVEISTNYFSKSEVAQEAIVKNTGLPELVKMQTSEVAQQMLKEQSLATAGNFIRDRLKNVGSRVTKNATQMWESFIGSVSDGMSNVSMAAQMADMGIPIDMAHVGGSMIGKEAGEWVAGKGADALGKKLAQHKGVRSVGNWLGRLVNEFGENANEFGRSSNDRDGMLGRVVDFFKELVGSEGRIDSVRSNATEYLDQAAAFTYRTQAAITEIIPGWLSKINAGITSLRTGKESELETYDYATGRFVTQSDAASRIHNKLFGKDTQRNLHDKFERVVKSLGIENKVSKAALRALKEIIIRRAHDGYKFNPEDYTDPSFYSGLTTDKIAQELSIAISARFPKRQKLNDLNTSEGKLDSLRMNASNLWNEITDDEYQTRRGIASSVYADFADALPDIRSMLIEEARTGNMDTLRAMGLVSLDGSNTNQNFDNVVKGLLGGRYGAGLGRRGKGGVDRGPGPLPWGGNPGGAGQGGFGDNGSNDPVQDMPNLDDLRTTIDDASHRIISALSDRASEDTTKASAEELAKIAQMVAALGSIVIQINQGNGGGPAVGDANSSMLFAELLGRGYKQGSRLTQFLWKRGKSARDLITNTLTKGFNFAKSGATGLFGMASQYFKDNKYKLEDIYIKGRTTVAIRVNNLLQGEYIDINTGKIIRSVEDITGEVRDKLGNIVITAEEAARGFYTRSGRNIILKIKDTIGKGVEAVTSRFTNIRNTLMNVGKTVLDTVAVYSDVYVKTDMSTPKLIAYRIRKGEYLLKSTNKPVTRYEDIVGEIIDTDGNVVLTADDIQAGLVDNQGKPIRGLTDRIFDAHKAVMGFGKKALSSVFNRLKKIGKGTWDLTKRIGKRLVGFGGENNGALIHIFGSQERSASILESIYNLLDQRLPNGGPQRPGIKTPSIFDTDGDGHREGGWQDKDDKSASDMTAVDKDKADTPDKKERKGIWGILKGIGGFVKTLAMGAVGFFPKALKIFSFLGSGIKMLIGGVKLLGGILKPIASLMGKLINNPLVKGLGKGLWEGGKFLARNLLSPKGMLVRGAMAVGSAVVGAVSLPVAAAAVAGGALLYGGYKLYKNMKAKDLNVLKARMVAYGIDPDNEERVEQVFKFEQLLSGAVSVGNGKAATLGTGVKIEDALNIFGVAYDDKERYPQWENWYLNRFKPIYLTYVTVNYDMKNGKDLTEIDSKLSARLRSEMLDRTQFPYNETSPYAISASPFDGDLDYDLRETRSELKDIRSRLKKLADKEPNAKDKPKDGSASSADKGKDGEKSGGIWDKMKGVGKSITDTYNKGFSTMKKYLTMGGVDLIKTGASALDNATGNRVSGALKAGANALMNAFSSTPAADYTPKKIGKLIMPADVVGEAMQQAAKRVGVSPGLMYAVARQESAFKPGAKAKTSSASGLFQFIKGTWDEMVKRYGGQFPELSKGPLDPTASAIAGALFMRDNANYLKRNGIEANPTNIYAAHFLGPGGAVKFLKQDPNALAAPLMPKEAAANKAVFYDQAGRPRTIAQVRQFLYEKSGRYAEEYAKVIGDTSITPDAQSTKTSETKPATPETVQSSTPAPPPLLAAPSPSAVVNTTTGTSGSGDQTVVKQVAQASNAAAAVSAQKSAESKATMDNARDLGDVLMQSLQVQLRMDKTMTEVRDVLFGIDKKFIVPEMRGSDIAQAAKTPSTPPSGSKPARSPVVDMSVNKGI